MAPSKATLEKYLKEATRQLYLTDPNAVTVNLVRQRAEEQNDLEKGFFVAQPWKARSKTLITEFVQTLLPDEPPSSIPDREVEQDAKHGVKRSSSDELSSPPSAKRRKGAASATASNNPRPKKESSSSALSELSELDDSDAKPKKEEKKATTTKKTTEQKEESDSELSELDFSEDEPQQKKKAKKPAAPRKWKKDESESELSDLSSSEDKPKPIKKRARKSEHVGDSDDGDKATNAKAATPRMKRKQPKATTKRTTKRTKTESDNEDKPGAENIAAKSEADVNMKMDSDAVEKDEGPGEDTKAGEKENKQLVDDSDSSLSSVIDEPPPKKRKGKDTKGAAKSKQPASREFTGDGAEIKKLQGQLIKCGVRKIWGIELKKYGSDAKAKIRHLRDMLRDVGMDGRFSEAKAREIKERRELMGELEAVNEMNELWGLDGLNGRASRSKAVRKSLKLESDEDNDDGDEQKPKGEEEDEKDPKTKATSRVSKRMADLAFLGSDSESE